MPVSLISDKQTWDKFVDASPYGTIFHKWDFLRIVEKHMGYQLLPYGIYKGTELICVFPVFYRNQPGLKSFFSPPPRSGVPYLGPVMSHKYDGVKQRRKEGYLNGVVDDIWGEMKKSSPNYVSISTVPRFDDVRAFKWNDFQANVNYTYLVGLNKSLDEIWNGFDVSCKKNIKACGSYDLVMKESKDVDTFYAIMAGRYGQQGLNYHIDPAYLRDILEAFPDHIKMYFLYNGSDIVGIEVTTQYKDRFTCWMGAATIRKDVPGNYHIRWELIKKAKQMGFKELELSGANTKQLCMNKSTFSPSLALCLSLHKKDMIGKLAELTYVNLIKRKKVLA